MAAYGNNQPFNAFDGITRMLQKEDFTMGKPENSIKNKVTEYVTKLGGPDKLKNNSALKRIYDAVDCWERGLELCQQGKGWEAVNLVFRGLVLDRRGCQHRFVNDGGPISGTTNNYIGISVRIMQKVAKESGLNQEQMEYSSDTCGVKIMGLRAHFSSLSGNAKEGQEEIALAIKHALHARSKWTRDTLPVLPFPAWGEGESILDDDVILTLYDIQHAILTKLALNPSPFAMPGEDTAATLQKSLKSADKALAISPTNIHALMHKAGTLWNILDSNKSSLTELYKKAAEGPAPDDEPLKAVAAYQYLLCRLFMYDKQVPTAVGMFKMMHDRAKKLEKYSEPVFGKAVCMGREQLKQHRKAYANLPDSMLISGSLDFYTTEEEKIEKTRAHLKPGMKVTTINDMSKEEYFNNTENSSICNNCHMGGSKLKMCGKCKSAWYCSTECQKTHWKKHKPNCISREEKPENIAINKQNKEINEQLNMEQMLKVIAYMYSVYNPDQKVPWKRTN